MAHVHESQGPEGLDVGLVEIVSAHILDIDDMSYVSYNSCWGKGALSGGCDEGEDRDKTEGGAGDGAGGKTEGRAKSENEDGEWPS